MLFTSSKAAARTICEEKNDEGEDEKDEGEGERVKGARRPMTMLAAFSVSGCLFRTNNAREVSRNRTRRGLSALRATATTSCATAGGQVSKLPRKRLPP